MKTINTLLLAGLVLCAVNARADYALSTTAETHNTMGNALTIYNPGSGTHNTVFDISILGSSGFYAGKSISLFQMDGSGNVLNDFSDQLNVLYTASASGLATRQALNSGTPYTMTVSWSAGSGLSSGLYALGLTVNQSSTAGGVGVASGTGYTYFNLQTSAVPEPSQAAAGGMLLGCGALVFSGRRWMKRLAQ